MQFGLKTLCHDIHETHILIKIDNTLAVAAVYKMYSANSMEMECKVLAIWDWDIARLLLTSLVHSI